MINGPKARFSMPSRWLHWSMAVMIIAMLFIGIGMAASVSERYRFLVALHRPLGVAILALVVVRLINRFLNSPPPLPTTLPRWQRSAALGSHALLYALLFALPLIGWGMLSAAPYPILIFGSIFLPPILSQDPELFAALRQTHTVLALLLYAVIVVHIGAALLHWLVRKDGVFESMTSLPQRRD